MAALIGLSHNGLGVVGGDYTNLVGLGGCQLECASLATRVFSGYQTRTDELIGFRTML